ncbi:hypothetical protein ACFWBC_32610 [Streptomyces sp. NPDC059985]|uniref:hypothetical protein n=1 Tax=Streptomyces sp. NPDC059985 TaxID=3347025 RepID=UPI0036A30F4A
MTEGDDYEIPGYSGVIPDPEKSDSVNEASGLEKSVYDIQSLRDLEDLFTGNDTSSATEPGTDSPKP